MTKKHYSLNQIVKKFGVTEEYFHRVMKPMMKADFSDELNKANIHNPDILLDEKNNLYLADSRDHSLFVNTGLTIIDYI